MSSPLSPFGDELYLGRFTAQRRKLLPWQLQYRSAAGNRELSASLSLGHLVVHVQPIGGYLTLGFLNGQGSRTHLLVEVVLHSILLVVAWKRLGRLRPEVGDVVGASQFQADQVICLVLPGAVGRYPVLGVCLVLLFVRDIPDALRIARLAHLIFGGRGDDSPRGAGAVRQRPVYLTSRALRPLADLSPRHGAGGCSGITLRETARQG